MRYPETWTIDWEQSIPVNKGLSLKFPKYYPNQYTHDEEWRAQQLNDDKIIRYKDISPNIDNV